MNKNVVIIGAGPAGLTSAYLLSQNRVPVTVLEADKTYVGGISRTVEYKGFYFDIGGHRFFSKSKAVEDLWDELLPDDMLERPRSSRIYYRGKYFSYPLKAFEALNRLGILESSACMMSYGWAKVFPKQAPKNFEDWVSNQFGKRLFNIFFKTYTEKVWGMSCKEISADWAAQRIKGLSLASAVWNAVKPKSKKKAQDKDKVIKTLIDSFRYPRKGPGMLWEAAAEKVKTLGGAIHMGCRVTGVKYDAAKKVFTVDYLDASGNTTSLEATDVISSAPIRDLVRGLGTAVPKNVVEASESLKYRDFLTVALMLKERDQFDDNWIYIHDPDVKVGRVQNFKSWSPEMVPSPDLCCYGLEYFCFEGDGLWNSSDASLIELATREVEKLGLASQGDILDGCVVRQPKAYPVYDDHYAEHVDVIRQWIQKAMPGLHMVGRNGMHKYNNQDHSMMTAMLTVQNIVADRQLFDVWQVNQDAEYHEAGKAGEVDSTSSTSGIRLVPSQVSS